MNRLQSIFSIGSVTLAGVMMLVFSSPVSAQQPPPDAEVTESAEASPDDTAAKLAALTKRLEAQEQAIAEIRNEAAQQKETSEKLLEDLALAEEGRELLEMQLMEATAPDLGPSFRVFGFMDLSFTKVWPPFEDAGLFAYTPRHSTFHQSNINVYLQSEMTPTMETLLEVRFTYMPNGSVSYMPQRIYLSGAEAPQAQPEYTVVNTNVNELYGGNVNLGGIVIERAQFDWKPRDWFKVRFGRYLTPFGIWNEDHASTVIIPSAEPFVISHNYLPTAQTGLMAFGSVFPTDFMGIDYAVTFSNGRGPFSEFYDLDENKALGLRAKMSFSGRDWHVKAGTYGYMGKYTDTEQEVRVYLNYQNASVATQDLRYDRNVDHPFSVNETVTEKYRELIISADLEINYRGLQLFSEYVSRKVEYIIPTPEDDSLAFFIGADPTLDTFKGDFVGQAAYVLLAWELPLRKWLKTVRITPYVGYDFLRPNDSRDYDQMDMFQFGLNVKPSSFVTLKTSAYAVLPKNDLVIGGDYWYWTNSLAVSF
jgi:hypothetical protein